MHFYRKIASDYLENGASLSIRTKRMVLDNSLTSVRKQQ